MTAMEHLTSSKLSHPAPLLLKLIPRHVKFFATPTELMQAYPINRPKLVLAIPPSMSHGPSRWLFTAMAGMEGNVILLTSRGEKGTLARKLFDDWQSFQQEDRKYGAGKVGAIGKIEQQIDVEVGLSLRNLRSV